MHHPHMTDLAILMDGRQTDCLSSSVLRYVQRNVYKEVETVVGHCRGPYHALDQDPGHVHHHDRIRDPVLEVGHVPGRGPVHVPVQDHDQAAEVGHEVDHVAGHDRGHLKIEEDQHHNRYIIQHMMLLLLPDTPLDGNLLLHILASAAVVKQGAVVLMTSSVTHQRLLVDD